MVRFQVQSLGRCPERVRTCSNQIELVTGAAERRLPAGASAGGISTDNKKTGKKDQIIIAVTSLLLLRCSSATHCTLPFPKAPPAVLGESLLCRFIRNHSFSSFSSLLDLYSCADL